MTDIGISVSCGYWKLHLHLKNSIKVYIT